MLHRCRSFLSTPPPTNDSPWGEPSLAYTAIPDQARYLDGYFQSPKYFHDVSGEIRELFGLPVAPSNWDSLPKQVAIHIRRGDYFPGGRPTGHGFLTDAYFTRAMSAARERFGPQVRFGIFSDDIAWCRRQPWLASANCDFIDENDEQISLWLMSQFNAFIISNSSFSWWAAYLHGPDSVVWAPDRWYGPLASDRVKQAAAAADIYMDSWIRLPTTAEGAVGDGAHPADR